MSHSAAIEGTAALKLVRPASPDLKDFLEKVYARENANVAGGSKATLADYRIQVRTLQKFFDRECHAGGFEPRPLTIEDITDNLVTGCMTWMRELPRSARTCNKLRRTIKTIHKFALEEKGLHGQPLRCKKFKELKLKPRAWRPEQISLLLAAALAMPPVRGSDWTGKHDYALLLFILNTGTRITAAMLTPKTLLELNADPPCVTVPADVQKHYSDEPFDLLSITVDALAAILPHSYPTIFGAWPFDSRERRKWRCITGRLKKILVRAGLFASVREIPKYKEMFHKLRKCFATFIRMKHGKAAARELCGHSGESVTDAYLDETQTGERPSCREALVDLIVLPRLNPQKRLFE